MRKDAVDYPDIDYDVASPMELKEMLIDEWGDDTVVPISNYNTLQLRSLVKDVSKFYDIPFTEVNNVTGKYFIKSKPKKSSVLSYNEKIADFVWDESLKYLK